jgi:hypothetical protein
MAIINKDNIQLDIKDSLPTPPTNSVSIGVIDGGISAKNSSGTAIDIGHSIMDGESTVYPARHRLKIMGDGVDSIADDATNDATVINIQGGGGGTGTVESFLSNCLTVAPDNNLTFSGNVIICAAGTKVLIPNGRNAGTGMFISIPYALGSSASVTENIGIGQGGVILLDSSGNLAIYENSKYVDSVEEPDNFDESDDVLWYNFNTNIMKTGISGQKYMAAIGLFTTGADGAVDSIQAFHVASIYNPIELKYWD